MSFSVTILGSSSASPALNRNPSAQLLNCNENLYLIDCGEGTQNRIRQAGLKMQRIKAIFISHLHGDHYFGLPGLLSTMHLLGRQTPLHLIGPEPLYEILLSQFRVSETRLRFPLHLIPTQDQKQQEVYADKHLSITSFPLNHRISTCGFLCSETPKDRKVQKSACEKHQVPLSFFNHLKKGEDYISPEGIKVANSLLTEDPLPPVSYAYCSDTAYTPGIADYIRGADLLYHEATFLHDMQERARETYHSTAFEAACMARDAEVKKLIIGHFSNRYKQLSALLKEACAVFPNTELAEEGKVFTV